MHLETNFKFVQLFPPWQPFFSAIFPFTTPVSGYFSLTPLISNYSHHDKSCFELLTPDSIFFSYFSPDNPCFKPFPPENTLFESISPNKHPILFQFRILEFISCDVKFKDKQCGEDEVFSSVDRVSLRTGIPLRIMPDFLIFR